MIVQDVFTPDHYPEYTYVEREHGEHEKDLMFRLQGHAAIVSLSGPSKAGKTMLVNKVVEKLGYDLVVVHGSSIDSIESLWENTLDELRAPTSTEIVESSQDETVKEGKAGIGTSFIGASAGGTKRNQEATQETISQARRGLKQITELVDLDKFVLYIDDAHYIDEEDHRSISEGIKDAYERGMSICVAFIPSRSDDLVRANPDLSGRVGSIVLDYWAEDDLEKIGKKGFKTLNRYPSDLILKHLARESLGSPHLMQKLCLEMCRELDVLEEAEDMTPLDAEIDDLKVVVRRAADDLYEGYSTIFDLISGDASKGSKDRKKYDYQLKGSGDIYDVILRAIASDPPQLTFSRKEIINRVDEICHDEKPQSGNLVQTIRRMDGWVTQKVPENSYCFDWVDDRNHLEIPDPYLVFCLRWSSVTDFEPKLQ